MPGVDFFEPAQMKVLFFGDEDKGKGKKSGKKKGSKKDKKKKKKKHKDKKGKEKKVKVKKIKVKKKCCEKYKKKGKTNCRSCPLIH